MVIKKTFWIYVIAAILLIIFLPGYSKLQELRDKNRDLADDIKRLEKENFSLQQELKRIEADPLYQEKITREKMGVVRKGEV
ncbi:MAG: septum formation initiator family protein, partial [Candidatus Omnitrophica bacterium]|nr:septum formation initiator family protein [Candidatus Omnitrophota bacterium]